jgi:hypothetical protein
MWMLLACVPGWAQEKSGGKITGRVIDDSTNAPIVNANVFIANTMLGTSTDTSGHFEIKNVPAGAHELVASCIGYVMMSDRIELLAGVDGTVDMRLKPRFVSLGIVEVTAPRPEAWRKDLERFARLLLGTTPETLQCRIVNPEILSFSTDLHGNFLARADTRLIVDNDALGYRLNLSLGEFRSESQWTYTDWKVIFEDLLPLRDQQAMLEQKRDEVYYGSLRHFLIALMNGRLAKEGFVMYQSRTGTTRRWDRMLELNEDDVSEPTGVGRRTLRFAGFLVVEYDRTRVEVFSGRTRAKASALSIEKDSVRIDSRGQILDPFALGVTGDWAKERLASQLPLEFHPKSKK